MTLPPRGRADFLELGTWNAVCYRCGRKRKAADMRRQWQGYWVCKEEWEPRHPQDFVRAVSDEQSPPWTQPPPGDVFAPNNFPTFCSITGGLGRAGVGEADCWVVGKYQ